MSPFLFLSSSTLILSSLMALSSTNWILLWAALEINIISFIPLIMASKLNQEIEASIKYFLAQALGSAVLLYSSTSLWLPMNNSYSLFNLTLIISLLLKLGSAPCHFWYPSVMASISWVSCLILSSWQKLAPLAILVFSFSSTATKPLALVAGMNAVIGGTMGMAQTQLRTLMAYSSIGHLGWMISLMLINKPFMSMLYFMVYCMIISPLFLLLNKLNFHSINQNKKSAMTSPFMLLSVAILLMSLGGLPPLTGFMPKLITIYLLLSFSQLLVFILILGSLMNLYFYLSISLAIFMSKETSNQIMIQSNQGSSTLILTAIFSLSLTPLIMF